MKSIKKWCVGLLFAVFFVSLWGCGEEDVIARVDGKALSRSGLESHLAFKRVDSSDGKRVGLMEESFVNRAALAAAIEKSGVLDKELMAAELEEFRREMLISRYFERFLAEAVTDETVLTYYNTHGSEYEEERARVAHILVRTRPDMEESERKARLTALQEAWSLVRTGRKGFEEVAESHSEDRISAKKGGDLGWIAKGSIDPGFSEKVFGGLEVGTVSEPFETPFGYHVVKLLEGPATVRKPFSSVSGDIRYQLRSAARVAEMERLQKSVKVERISKGKGNPS
ncbi:peptidylprolyl isomerase [Desulfobotulus sp.]|jgi:peptidyl-prolyl cis-trans isomerase C|uniref:peptidylprolyl isomerase n=1 Tax=Desulfobotulus sp. TaxID=1940337 RepID=UPI002A36DE50|nr:peptidylprolyl isomerase [Desulfobotulus sp.]MDY0163294.1 peptidylprolyl isomerase [Desulfobotulus sp.]